MAYVVVRSLLVLSLLLTCRESFAQDAHDIRQLLERGRQTEAVNQVRSQGGRDSLLAEGEAWLDSDSIMWSVPFFLEVTHDKGGTPIIDSLAGLAFHKAANAYYRNSMDEEAVIYYRRAIAVRDSLYPYAHQDRAHSRINLSNSLSYLRQLDSAVLVIREATALYDALPSYDSLNYLRNLNRLASLAKELRDFRLAYSATYRAVSLIEQIPDADADEKFVTYHNAGLTMLRLDKLDEALTYAERAVTAARKSQYPLNLPTAYNLLAIVQRELGDEKEGFANLKQAEGMITPTTRNELIFGEVYLNLAEYYGGLDDVKDFEIYRRRARQLFEKSDIRIFYASEKIPEILLKWKRYDEVLKLVNERIDYFMANADPGSSGSAYAAEDVVPLIDLLSVRALVCTAMEKREAALADYAIIFDLQNQLRHGVSTEDSRRYLSRNLRPFFDSAISLHFAAYQESGADSCLWLAFELSEQSRAFSLLAALHANKKGLSPQESQLIRTVADLERQVSVGKTDRQPALEEARIRLDRLSHENRSSEQPDEPFNRAKLINYLRQNDCDLLEYHLTREGSLVFLLTSDGSLSAVAINNGEKLPDRVERFRRDIERSAFRRKSLRTRALQDSLDGTFLAMGIELSNQLLPPAVRESLHLRPRLCIVPDGVLNYLPFAALPLAEAKIPLDYAALDYLQGATQLQFSYSARYLVEVSRKGSPTYARNLLAFAPSFGKSGPVAETRGGSTQLRGENILYPLPYNREEVEEVSQLVSDAVALYGPDANRQRFLEELGSSRILHLSSHGSVNPTDPNLSFVAFTQTGDSLQQEEMLYFNDLYGLPIGNELTVLSACETALGKLAVGETTMSLASAFAAAGAKSTITTLWQVDDRATKDLIVDFYRRLVNGESRSEALNGAQEELRGGEYAHPYYWSGITLYGAAGPLPLDGGPGLPAWSYWLVGVLIVVVAGVGLLKLRERSTGRAAARAR